MIDLQNNLPTLLFRGGTAFIPADIVLGDNGTIFAVRFLQIAIQAVRVPAPEYAAGGQVAGSPYFSKGNDGTYLWQKLQWEPF